MTRATRRDVMKAGGLAAAAVVPVAARAATRGAEMGFKINEFIKRPERFCAENWLEHWQTVRKELALRIPGVRSASFNLVNADYWPDARYDAVVQYEFATHADLVLAVDGARDPDLDAQWLADGELFQDSEPFTLITRTRVIRSLPQSDLGGMAKRIGLVGRQPRVPKPRFLHEWEHVHAPEVLGVHGLEGYTLSMAEGPQGISTPWDGFAELWWTDWETLDESRRRGSNNYKDRESFFHDHLLLYVTQYA